MTRGGRPTRVAVCALTLDRPAGVRALLEGLAALDHPGPDVEVRVVIVDNDRRASARPIVEELGARLPWPLEYSVEPRRGIPFGRNRAVAVAGEVDFVAFIDDDEVPDPGWLTELLRVQRASRADVVTGPVIPVFDEPPPRWASAGAFFDRPRFPTGTPIRYARTSNVLIAAHVFPRAVPPFKEEFGLTGGDDTHFFMRSRLDGHRIVWADDAVVREAVPTSRVTPGWVRRREYRRGNTLSLCLLDLTGTPWRKARRAALGIATVVEGVGVVAAAPFLGARGGRIGTLRGQGRMWFGAGLLSGLTGRKFEEYRVIHGR